MAYLSFYSILIIYRCIESIYATESLNFIDYFFMLYIISIRFSSPWI